MKNSYTAANSDRLPIAALFTANAISMVGNILAMISIPWYVLQTTGSATQTGITGFFSILPVVLAGFLGARWWTGSAARAPASLQTSRAG